MTRLIDADKLPIVSGYFLTGENMARVLCVLKGDIDDAPTVKDRTNEVLSLQTTIRKLTQGERGIGYWTKEKTDKTHYIYTCSVCGARSRFTKAPYCYKCGSRMIEG